MSMGGRRRKVTSVAHHETFVARSQSSYVSQSMCGGSGHCEEVGQVKDKGNAPAFFPLSKSSSAV
jgi:hypothetical protein